MKKNSLPHKTIVNDIIQWDVKSWSKALTYWDKNVDWNSVETCLELGGREGGLSLWLVLKGKTTVCSDLNDVEQTAETLHTKHNVKALVTYQDIDATQIPYENHFDIIVFKSIIGGIGRDDQSAMQQQVFDQIYKALKPGGKLLFAENLKASAFHQQMRKKFVNWGRAWRYVSLNEMKGFLHMFTSYQIKTTGVLATFGRNEKQRNALATLDQSVLNNLCPNKWKYICYGIAEK